MQRLLRLPTLIVLILVVPIALFAARLVWEQTVLSWRQGPQDVGAFVPSSPLGVAFWVYLLLATVWAIVVLLVAAMSRQRPSLASGIGAAVIVAGAGLVSVPYGTWVRYAAATIAAGPHAADFLVYMAARGDVRAVQALLEKGVPAGAPNRIGLTAMEAARRANRGEVVRVLAGPGASASSAAPAGTR